MEERESRSKCFVPECNNSVGVLFPKNTTLKNNWLKCLNLEHLEPDRKSFVCLDHFEENGMPSLRKKQPSSLEIQEKRKSMQNTQVSKVWTRNPKENGNFTNLVNKDSETFVNRISNNQYKKEAIREPVVFSIYEKQCRLCLEQSSNVTENVFNKFDKNQTIAWVISRCLYPLKILPNDNISKFICKNCLQQLRQYFAFYQNCMENDTKQQNKSHVSSQVVNNSKQVETTLTEQNDNYYSDGNYAASDHSGEYLHEERLSDYEEDKENKEDTFRVQAPAKGTNQPTNSKSALDKIANLSEVTIKKKYGKAEEELIKVLEGNNDVILTKVNKSNYNKDQATEMIFLGSSVCDNNDDSQSWEHIPQYTSQKDDSQYTESIIIEVVDDTSNKPSIEDTTRPVIIKRLRSKSPKGGPAKKQFNNIKSVGCKSNFSDENEIPILPKEISIKKKDVFKSVMGQFNHEIIKYLYDIEYLVADNYVYDYGLTKNNIRTLHCIVRNCLGRAHQTKYNTEYSNEVEVVKSHNHEPPDKIEQKRQMFYHVLYHRMRRDKHFNFKILYEECCSLDPDLTYILPLRTVIKEICKQGPSPPLPSFKSFDDLYRLIEKDDCRRIHFTENGVQFYQERFECDDGSKAVLFANSEEVQKYSYCKMLYVDASFIIDTEDFPCQLVTMSVCIDNNYYPIIFALVSDKSQELYKKIFGYIYNELASNMRPSEIITDYEANLYYALGETYVESSIGGSVFYFTQNIYKKICELCLTRHLETNSHFRSIYNMLMMLPLLPVNTILDGVQNIEVQAKDVGVQDLTEGLFEYIRNEWIYKVTPELFCVHRLENRINENVLSPFKKLRDLITLTKTKLQGSPKPLSVVVIIEKLIEFEKFIRENSKSPPKKPYNKDYSSSQKKLIVKTWDYIETHPLININVFFLKVVGFIKCMENQLWIWGFYRYQGKSQDTLIDATNFSIINDESEVSIYQEHLDEPQYRDEPIKETEEEMEIQDTEPQESDEEDESEIVEEYYIEEGGTIRKVQSKGSENNIEALTDDTQELNQEDFKNQKKEDQEEVVMEAVLDENGSFVLKEPKKDTDESTIRILNYYVYK